MSLGREYVVFDTETTGMPPSGRLVEIGALKVRGRTVVDRFERLVFPEGPIPPEVSRIHGIVDADVEDAPVAGPVLREFLEFAGDAPLVGHNVAFDAATVAGECLRFGLPLPRNPTWCTLRAARSVLRQDSNSLEALVRDLGLPPAAHHRALADAEHALHLLWRLMDALGDRFKLSAFGRGRALDAHAPEPVALPAAQEALRRASESGEGVGLRYRLASGWISRLAVTPRLFYRRGGALYMEALCHEDCYFKSYRLDRVVGAEALPDAAPVEVRRRFGARR